MRRFNTIFFMLLLVALSATSLGSLVHAQTQLGGGNAPGTQLGNGNSPGTQLGGGNSGGLQNPLTGINDLPTLLSKVLGAVVVLGSVVVTLMLVYCGFLFVVAQGKEEKIREARTALMWTVIGAIILLGAQFLSSVIANTVNSLGTSS